MMNFSLEEHGLSNQTTIVSLISNNRKDIGRISFTLIRVLYRRYSVHRCVEAFLGLQCPQCVASTTMTRRKATVLATERLTLRCSSKTITKSAHGACFQQRDNVYEPRYAMDNKCATIKRLWYRYCPVCSWISVLGACVHEVVGWRAKKPGESEKSKARYPLMERMDREKWEDREYTWKPPPLMVLIYRDLGLYGR